MKFKNKKSLQRYYLPLIITGYVLFFLLVIATISSTVVPFGILLLDPRVLHANVAVSLIALTVGALLPAVLAYAIGDHAVKNKSKLSHHFNGVLLGLLGYWVVLFAGYAVHMPSAVTGDDFRLGLTLNSILPALVVVLVTGILATMHIKSRAAKNDIVTYKPFVVTLCIAIAALPIWLLIQGALQSNFSFAPLASLGLTLLVGIIAYVTLRGTKLATVQKVGWAAVSLSVLFAAQFVMAQFVFGVLTYIFETHLMETQALIGWLAAALALIGWAVYWVRQVTVLKAVK